MASASPNLTVRGNRAPSKRLAANGGPRQTRQARGNEQDRSGRRSGRGTQAQAQFDIAGRGRRSACLHTRPQSRQFALDEGPHFRRHRAFEHRSPAAHRDNLLACCAGPQTAVPQRLGDWRGPPPAPAPPCLPRPAGGVRAGPGSTLRPCPSAHRYRVLRSGPARGRMPARLPRTGSTAYRTLPAASTPADRPGAASSFARRGPINSSTVGARPAAVVSSPACAHS